MPRRLVLAAYDVTDPRRLARALGVVTAWAHGGQKSVFECYARPEDRAALAAALRAVLDLREDRLGLFAASPDGARTLGRGRVARDEPVLYIG